MRMICYEARRLVFSKLLLAVGALAALVLGIFCARSWQGPAEMLAANAMIPLWTAGVYVPVALGLPFEERAAGLPLEAGFGKPGFAAARTLLVCLFSALFSAVATTVAAAASAGVRALDAAYFLALLRTLPAALATAALPAAVVWWTRSAFAGLVIFAAVDWLLPQAPEALLRLHPVTRIGEAVTGLSAATWLVCAAFLAAAVVSGYLSLRLRDMKG